MAWPRSTRSVTNERDARWRERSREVLTEGSEEAWAFAILRRHLVALGHAIANVREPDTSNRETRDVDFLIEFDGREVAIEVTRFDQKRQQWVLLERVQAEIVAQLSDCPQSAPGLLIELSLLRTGSYAEVDAAAQSIVALVRDWAPDLGVRNARVAGDLVEVELRPRHGPGLLVSRRTGAHDARLDPRAAAFVKQLIKSKKAQGVMYAELWLLVIDMELIIGLDLIQAAFAEFAAEVPPNWSRLYLLPAADRDDVQALMLHG